MDGALFLHEGYMVRNPRGVSDRVYQTDLMKLVGLLFIHFFFGEVVLMILFLERVGVRPCLDTVLHYYRTKVWHMGSYFVRVHLIVCPPKIKKYP